MTKIRSEEREFEARWQKREMLHEQKVAKARQHQRLAQREINRNLTILAVVGIACCGLAWAL